MPAPNTEIGPYEKNKHGLPDTYTGEVEVEYKCFIFYVYKQRRCEWKCELLKEYLKENFTNLVWLRFEISRSFSP